MLFSSGKALAYSNCPAGETAPANWGPVVGGHSNAMAGIITYAKVGTYTSPDPNTGATAPAGVGNPLSNVSYQLNSDLPGVATTDGYPANERIFAYPAGSGGRWSQKFFTTGENISAGSAGSYSCPGWSVLGPGNSTGEQGNGYVVDCGELVNGNYISTQFWVSVASNPTGQSGKWELQINGVTKTTDLNGDSSSTDRSHYFTVDNGFNARLELIWHPDPPPEKPKPPTPSCQQYTVTDDKSGATGSHSYTQVWISGTNNDQNNYHIAYGDSHTFGYRALSQTITIHVERYHNGNSNPYDQYTKRIDCYHATCKPNETGIPITVQGDGPNGIVQAGHAFTVYVPVRNDNLSSDGEIIPDPDLFGSYALSVTESPDDYQGGLVEHAVPGGYLNKGRTTIVPITYYPNGNTSSVRNMTLNFYPDLWPHGTVSAGNNSGNDDGSCSVSFTIYQYFTDSLGASSTLLDQYGNATTENPASDTYSTTVSVSGTDHAVNIPTGSLFYKKPASGGQININGNSGGTYQGPSTTAFSGTYGVPPGSFQAGDEYCSTINAAFGSGYVGPDNNAIYVGPPPATATSCPKIANEPYFKVKNGSISAGGDFDQCTNSGGLLAGYNNNIDNGGASDRGASAELSNLALIKISGVASAQTPFGGLGSGGAGAARLTFANTGGVSVNADANHPDLGGNAGGCASLTNETPPNNAVGLPAATVGVGGLNGAYTRNGNVTINGGTVTTGHSVGIYVNGNVYINGNIGFDATGAVVGTAPSLIIHATGNIYIRSDVTQLSGIYVAQQKKAASGAPDTTTGKIYTCYDPATGQPVSAANLYAQCSRQLTVIGSFAADQVNLMRTFGSLRDETPKTGTKIINTGRGDGSVPWNRYYCGGDTYPGTHLYITAVNPPIPNVWWCGFEGTIGYILPPNNASPPPGSVPWYVVNGSNGKDFYYASYGEASFDGGRPCAGGVWPCTPTLAGYVFYSPPPGIPVVPLFGVYGLSSETHFYTTSWQEYVNVANTGNEMPLGVVAYLYAGPGYGESFGSTVVNTPLAPPSPMTCSNNGGGQSVQNTCAGEVFEFSPQLYLSNPSVCPAGSCGSPGGTTGGNSTPYQVWTSLPPVL